MTSKNVEIQQNATIGLTTVKSCWHEHFLALPGTYGSLYLWDDVYCVPVHVAVKSIRMVGENSDIFFVNNQHFVTGDVTVVLVYAPEDTDG